MARKSDNWKEPMRRLGQRHCKVGNENIEIVKVRGV